MNDLEILSVMFFVFIFGVVFGRLWAAASEFDKEYEDFKKIINEEKRKRIPIQNS